MTMVINDDDKLKPFQAELTVAILRSLTFHSSLVVTWIEMRQFDGK